MSNIEDVIQANRNYALEEDYYNGNFEEGVFEETKTFVIDMRRRCIGFNGTKEDLLHFSPVQESKTFIVDCNEMTITNKNSKQIWNMRASNLGKFIGLKEGRD